VRGREKHVCYRTADGKTITRHCKDCTCPTAEPKIHRPQNRVEGDKRITVCLNCGDRW
jgi:hypothetical protein